MYSVYILYSPSLNKYYVGTTDNIPNRVHEHNSKFHLGAFTNRGIPWKLFFSIEQLSSKQAYSIERHIKSMKSTAYIIRLKQNEWLVNHLKIKFTSS